MSNRKYERLVIIGNGFDIYHGLKTSYQDFGAYLKDEHISIYSRLSDFYSIHDGNELWGDFENSLSLLDKDLVLEHCSNYLEDISSEDFRDRDRYSFDIEVDLILKRVTDELFESFKQFILKVDSSLVNFSDTSKLNLNVNDLYLSFNYTNTLIKSYGVDEDDILFIHGQASNSHEELILGHGIDPESFREEKEPVKIIKQPGNLSREQYEAWQEERANEYDERFDVATDKILDYFSTSFKDTESLIQENDCFFEQARGVSQVFVLGHSLSDVDIPYFDKIVDSVGSSISWVVSYFGEEEKESHLLKLMNLGIEEKNINLIRIEELI